MTSTRDIARASANEPTMSLVTVMWLLHRHTSRTDPVIIGHETTANNKRNHGCVHGEILPGVGGNHRGKRQASEGKSARHKRTDRTNQPLHYSEGTGGRKGGKGNNTTFAAPNQFPLSYVYVVMVADTCGQCECAAMSKTLKYRRTNLEDVLHDEHGHGPDETAQQREHPEGLADHHVPPYRHVPK